jgi:hypothetical protein
MRNYDYNEPVDSTLRVGTSLDEACKEYIRPRMDYLRDYEINIRFLSLGCIVRVGCKEIAFTSIQEAIQEVNEYIANPKLLSDKYNKLINQGNG